MALSRISIRKLLKRTAKRIKEPAERAIAEEGKVTELPWAPGRRKILQTDEGIQVIPRTSRFEAEEEVNVPVRVLQRTTTPTTPVVEEEKKPPQKEETKEEAEKPKVEKPMIFEFQKLTEELRSSGIIAAKELEKGGVRGAPLGMPVAPGVAGEKISSEWEPPKLSEVDVKYSLIEPYAYATIKWNDALGELGYTLIEPPLTDKESKTLEKIKGLIVDLLDINLMDIKKHKRSTEILERKTKPDNIRL